MPLKIILISSWKRLERREFVQLGANCRHRNSFRQGLSFSSLAATIIGMARFDRKESDTKHVSLYKIFQGSSIVITCGNCSCESSKDLSGSLAASLRRGLDKLGLPAVLLKSLLPISMATFSSWLVA